MNKSLLILILIFSLFSFCTKDEIKINPNDPLIGIWDFSEYQDNAIIFTRSQVFIDNYCYKFNSDGTLIERNIAGRCATPPVSYTDYRGRWTILNDTLIHLDVNYFDISGTYKLDIEAVTLNSLKIIYIGDNR
jgi:hypothetical protein